MSANNFSREQLMRLLMNSKGNNSESLAEDIIKNQITPEQRQRINSVLRDKSALESLLNSPQAQELMKKIGKKQ